MQIGTVEAAACDTIGPIIIEPVSQKTEARIGGLPVVDKDGTGPVFGKGGNRA